MMEMTEHKPEKLEKSSNLSAFVCADELEDKDVEIQNERKKKMQEIAENIGIKVDKVETLKRISIIDQLKNRMETSLPVDEKDNSVTEKMDTENGQIEPSSVVVASSKPSEENIDPLHLIEQELVHKTQDENSSALLPQSVQIKDDPDALKSTEEDKTGAKMKDPLSFVDEPTKKYFLFLYTDIGYPLFIILNASLKYFFFYCTRYVV
jgi:hypothetical protein